MAFTVLVLPPSATNGPRGPTPGASEGARVRRPQHRTWDTGPRTHSKKPQGHFRRAPCSAGVTVTVGRRTRQTGRVAGLHRAFSRPRKPFSCEGRELGQCGREALAGRGIGRARKTRSHQSARRPTWNVHWLQLWQVLLSSNRRCDRRCALPTPATARLTLATQWCAQLLCPRAWGGIEHKFSGPRAEAPAAHALTLGAADT